MNNQQIIQRYYENPKYGFSSADKLYPKIKKDFPNITKKEITDYIKNQSTHQIHTNQKINKNDFNQITAKGLGYFQFDLIDMSNYKKHNEGYRYILLGVDVKSRFGLMEALKTKTAEEVYRAFLKMEYYCESVKHRIYAIYCDKGNEFSKIEKNKDKYNYKVFYKEPNTHRGSGIIDRRVRTFRELLEKYFTNKDTLNWIDVYQQINTNINETENRTTKEEPYNIWTEKETSKQIIRKDKPVDKFNIGDYVRVKNINGIFTKNSTGLFSNKIYKIKEISGLGFYVDGIKRKLFPVDVKRVDGDDKNNENIEKLRNNNKKNNTIKRRLNKEGIFEILFKTNE
jgi:hypothetical protein